MTKSPTVLVTFRLNPTNHEAIKQLAARDGRRQSDLIRRAIHEFLDPSTIAPLESSAEPGGESGVIRACRLLQELRSLTKDELHALLKELGIAIGE